MPGSDHKQTMSSSVTMAADSTQSDLREQARKRKLKKKEGTKKKKKDGKGKKGQRKKKDQDLEASDCDSDLDLNKELKPISAYIRDRDLTIEHLFRSISGKKMKAMLPEILKPIPLEELKKQCLEQLECMSKKRIKRLLQGADPETISSSGTDDDDLSTDEDVRRHHDDSNEDESKSDLVADSTCQKSEDNNNDDELLEELAGSPGRTPSDHSASPRESRSAASSVYRSPGSDRPSPWGSQYAGTSDGESQYSSSSNNEAGSSDESESETEYIEEVVVEEIYLDEGDDLEQMLHDRIGRSSIEVIDDSDAPRISAHEPSHKQIEGPLVPQETNVTAVDPVCTLGEKGEDMDVDAVVSGASGAGDSQVLVTATDPSVSPCLDTSQPANNSDEVMLDTGQDRPAFDSRVSTEPPEETMEEETLSVQADVGILSEQSAEGTLPVNDDMLKKSPGLKMDTDKEQTDTSREETESTKTFSGAAVKEAILESEVPMELSAPERSEACSKDISMDDKNEGTTIPDVQPKEQSDNIQDPQQSDNNQNHQQSDNTQDQLRPEEPMAESSSDPVTDSMTAMDQESDPSTATCQTTADTASETLETKDIAQELEEGELEEGELEDSSGEEQLVDQPQTRSHSESENIEQVKDFPKTSKRSKVKKKKKVKVIKRVIKVIRRKAVPQQTAEKSMAGFGTETVSAELAPSKPEQLGDSKGLPDTPPSVTAQPDSVTQAVSSKSSTVDDTIRSATHQRASGSGSTVKAKTEPVLARSKATKNSSSAEEKALNKMEILELEMRARAIKAMLRKHEQGGPSETKSKRIKLKRN